MGFHLNGSTYLYFCDPGLIRYGFESQFLLTLSIIKTHTNSINEVTGKMSSNNQPRDTPNKNQYGLAVEEIKLERSIRKLTTMMRSLNAAGRPKYLAKEIAIQEKRLRSLRESRSSS